MNLKNDLSKICVTIKMLNYILLQTQSTLLYVNNLLRKLVKLESIGTWSYRVLGGFLCFTGQIPVAVEDFSQDGVVRFLGH